MMMIRECRKKPLESPIPEKILQKATEVLQQDNQKSVMNFLKSYGKLFRNSKQLTIYKIREKFLDMLCLMKIQAITAKDNKKLTTLNTLSEQLSDKVKQVNYTDFVDFVKTSKSRLENALKNKKDIIFVMGHKNPDTDTVISCLFEAWRNHVADK